MDTKGEPQRKPGSASIAAACTTGRASNGGGEKM